MSYFTNAKVGYVHIRDGKADLGPTGSNWVQPGLTGSNRVQHGLAIAFSMVDCLLLIM